MVTGIIGRKVGMTQVFDPDGTVHPATVIKAGPCVVVQAKNAQSDGYEAVQLGQDFVAYRLIVVCVLVAFAALWLSERLTRSLAS